MVRRRAVAALVSLVLAACGGGGSGSDDGFEPGPADWGVPFLPASASRAMRVSLRNLDADATTAAVTFYRADGTAFTGGALTLDGEDHETFLAPSEPGGWAHVATPSRRVEVGFTLDDDPSVSSESSRAWPLGDLGAPPPTTVARVTITSETTLVQVVNAGAAATVVGATAWVPGPTPSSPWEAVALAPIPLAAHAAASLTPAALTGTPDFFGAVELTSATPVFVATEEGPLALDGVPKVVARDRDAVAVVQHGPLPSSPASWTDFAMLLRNDADDPRTVVLQDVTRADGSQILLATRTIELAARETLGIATTVPPFDDLFGDATTALSLTTATVRVLAPDDVDVSFRQFDPVSLIHVATVRPAPTAHVADVLQVAPEPLLPSLARTYLSVHNPGLTSITVNLSAVVPQPDGFDAALEPLEAVDVPAGQTVTWSPDGRTFLDRDLDVVPWIGVRATSPAPFHLLGRSEERSATGLLLLLRPAIVRSHDDAD